MHSSPECCYHRPSIDCEIDTRAESVFFHSRLSSMMESSQTLAVLLSSINGMVRGGGMALTLMKCMHSICFSTKP